MTTFIDANVPMYLLGAEHPNKSRVRVLLDELTIADERFATNTEVYQELLHRYTRLARPYLVDAGFTLLDELADELCVVDRSVLNRARQLVREGAGARDAVHAATMQANGIDRILSFDRGFDRLPGLQRIH